MKFYLSSYKLGNETEKLKSLFIDNKKVGYIANALDSKKNTVDWLTQHIQEDLQTLKDIELEPERIDLREFFGNQDALQKKLNNFGGVWISGGNVFILRQAMKFSGLDEILKTVNTNFVYGGYSAAACVLSPKLDAYKIVDDFKDFSYQNQNEQLWDGLGFINYVFLQHYDSDHSESDDINKEIQYCTENNIPFKALRDGEVLIF
jgi:dipeptidase E